ncbi:MAG: hypothetical protein EP346_07745 [Bacteroidetes bacterium]|nr:MAG: hypothetical protein EP346_07745 [Bacteroidota bacterium]
MNYRTLYLFAVLAFATLFSVSCSNEHKVPENDPAFTQYISAHTAGVISAYSSIQVHLQTEVNPGVEPGTLVEAEIFDFSPDIEGTTTWSASNIITFTPDAPLPPRTAYEATFNLGALLEVPSALKEYEFVFQSMERGYSFLNYQIAPYSNRDMIWNKLSGSIQSYDVSNIEELAEEISFQNAGDARVSFIQNGTDQSFTFNLDSVERKAEGYEIEAYHGDKQLMSMRVPSLGEFEVVNTSVVQSPRQEVTISFSDPLLSTQSVTGLFQLDGVDVSSVQIVGSVVKLYPSSRLTGDVKLEVFSGLKNVLGYSFPTNYTETISFQAKNPEIEFIDDGNIIPLDGKVNIPFKAVNVKAVDVRIYKVFADNVHQFMQVNDIRGSRELRRVARPIHQERVNLTGEGINYSEWTTFSIDLDKMIRRDPGALYRVELSLRREYSLYPCDDDEDVSTEVQMSEENWEYDESEYFYSDYDNHYYTPGYRYSERNNPCHVSYYTSRRSISKNVFATDIGMVVKGNNGEFTVLTNSLGTASPLASVKVEFFNYQGQLMGSSTTDQNGVAKLKVDGVAFLARASKGNQRAFLTLEPGRALNISNFEVGGSDVSDGIQAYLYGERGIWRPGDTIFLDAILNDVENPLPANHPITVTVRDVENKEIYRKVVQRGTQSLYSFQVITDRAAKTGTYSAVLEVGGKRFYKSLPVETVQPNRFDIKVSAENDIVPVINGKAVVNVDAEWLTGIPASGSAVTMQARVYRAYRPFEDFADYDFYNDIKSYPNPGTNNVYDGQLDDEGHVEAQLNLGSLSNSPGMLNLTLSSKVFEPSGRFSVNSKRLALSPFNHYVGVKMPETNTHGYLETNVKHTLNLARVDATGKPVSGRVKVSIYQVKWSWWWSAQRGNATYLNREYSTLITQGNADITNGKGSFDFTVKDDQWGRIFILVEDADGHSTSALGYVDWPWGRDRSGRRTEGESISSLSIQLDKEKYTVDETATVTIPSSVGGRLLVTIEDGTEVLEEHFLETQEGSTTLKLKIKPNMAPNAYIYAMLLQPHAQTVNDLPIRMYGIMPLMVENPATHLNPVIDAPESIRPNSDYSITVKEESGAEMEYTLAVVDEGLLGISNFSTPNPWTYFYAKRALGVRTWDMYDYVAGAFGGQIAQMLAVGGDGALLPNNEQDADRFIPIVRHIGPFKLAPGKSQTHQLHMPNYIGNVRVMVVAANKKEAYGSASENIVVKQPLMVQLTMPRVLGPQESPKIPVTLFVMDESIRSVDVKLEVDGPLSVANRTQTVRFDGKGQKTIFFDGSVAERLGLAHVKVTATSGREKSKDEIEIGVRSPILPQSREFLAVVENAPVNHSEEPFGLKGSNELTIEVSSLPSLNLGERLNYLIGYPHGCLEQTTSKSFAQLNLDKWVTVSTEQKAAIQMSVREGLMKLRRMQAPSGGFRYWPSRTAADPWGSTYAGHFLISAEMSGYTLPIGLKEGYLRYEKQMARTWNNIQYYSYNNDFNQAYRLYVLALAGEPELGAMNRLRNRSNLSTTAAHRLAAAFAIMGEKEVATELYRKTWAETSSRYYYYSYGSEARDLAFEVEALLEVGQKAEALRLARKLAESLSKGQPSTQTIAYGLHALSRVFNGQPDRLKATVVAGGKTYEINTTNVTEQIVLTDFDQTTNVTVTNHETGSIYVRYLRTGIPHYGEEQPAERRVNMKVTYLDPDNNPLDISKLVVGTPIIAEVEISRTSGSEEYNNMALTQIFPSGWEISNSRVVAISGTSSSHYDYQDIRDDRVMTYFNMQYSGTQVVRIELTASYPGRWYMPPCKVEAMYESTIEATNKGQWVEVISR